MSEAYLTDCRHVVLSNEETPMSRRYLRILEQWVPVGLEYYKDWPDRPDCGHFLGGCHWYGIDTVSGAFVYALAASSPEYDEQRAGCSREDARRIALKALRYLCYTHDTGPEDCVRPETPWGRPAFFGTKWGERGSGFFPESQCSTTLVRMYLTALLLGDLMDDETWAMMAGVFTDYGHRFGDMAPRNGVYIDTQMEENAWTAAGLAAVECLLPAAPEAAVWAQHARQLMFSAATAPQDAKNHRMYDDGRTVAQWTGKIITTLPDYMAENHGMIHPSYTASAIMYLNKIGLVYGICDRPIPRHAFFNRQRIYNQLKRMTDRSGAFHPAQGMDWPYLPPDAGTGVHAAASLLLNDPDAAHLERQALATLEYRQTGTGGRIYDRVISERCHDIQDPLLFRESMIALPGYSYLLHRLFGDGPAPEPEEAFENRMQGVRIYPQSGFIFQRHETGQTSFSWRNCIMALPLNRDGVYTVAPASHSLLAQIQVTDQPDSQDLIALHTDIQDKSFAAAMVMDRAQGSVRQQTLFAGLSNGASISVERLTARKPVSIERLDQGFLRIINETFSALPDNCHGARTLYTPEGEDVFHSAISTTPDDDVIRDYEHPCWLNVDDRLGIVFKGSGRTVYHNRHYFETWWAVADDLILSREAPHRADEGETAAELTAFIVPDQKHQDTAAATFVTLQSDGDAFGVIADHHLTAAFFEAGCLLKVERSVFERIPVFTGTTSINIDSVVYQSDLVAAGAILRSAVCYIRVDGVLTVTAVSSDRLALHNTGDVTARVWLDDEMTPLTIQPGEAAMQEVSV